MNLDSDFERKLQSAVLDDIEQRAREQIAPEVQHHAHEILRSYGQRHDYDVGTIIDAGETAVERTGRAVRIRWGWPEPAIYFERGTVDHRIEATNADVLSFIWEDPPQWVREEFEPEGDGYRVYLPETNVSGLPESRFIRDTLNWLRRRYQR